MIHIYRRQTSTARERMHLTHRTEKKNNNKETERVV